MAMSSMVRIDSEDALVFKARCQSERAMSNCHFLKQKAYQPAGRQSQPTDPRCWAGRPKREGNMGSPGLDVG